MGLSRPNEVGWEELSVRRYVTMSTSVLVGVRYALYPISLVKTRLQAAAPGSVAAESGSGMACVRSIWAREGLRGFYHGASVVAVGVVPSQLLYFLTLEAGRAKLPLENASLRAALAGGLAGLLAMSVSVPADVVSQRMMVGRTAGEDPIVGSSKSQPSALQVAKGVLQKEGIRGLYRGFFTSILVMIPVNSLFWAMYYPLAAWLADRPAVRKYSFALPLAQFSSAAAVGMVTAALTNPLDVVKTVLQVNLNHNRTSPGFWGALNALRAEHGWSFASRGISARMVNLSLHAAIMTSVYELIKRLSSNVPPSDLGIQELQEFL